MPIPKEGFSPSLEEEMRRENIVFASDGLEALSLAAEIPNNEFLVCAVGDLDFLLNRLLRIDESCPSWRQLEGVRVLDLAAGSCNTHYSGATYEPHFSRLCAVNGAEVVAIDIRKQSEHDKMLFQPIEADLVQLVQEGQLAEIPELSGRRFDIIHSSAFVGWNPDPQLEGRLGTRTEIAMFEEKLILECTKLLAEGGVMSHDDNPIWKGRVSYRKINGSLITEVKEPTI